MQETPEKQGFADSTGAKSGALKADSTPKLGASDPTAEPAGHRQQGEATDRKPAEPADPLAAIAAAVAALSPA